MCINLSTTRTDGGWMYFKISGDSYMQVSGSGNKVNMFKDTTISGNLDVGVCASSSIVKAHVNHEGSTGSLQLEARWRNQSFLSPGTTYGSGYIFFLLKHDYYMYCGNNGIYFCKPTTNASDDRLKENDELIRKCL